MADPVEPTKVVEPGQVTTEFWLTIAGNIGTIIITVAGVLDPKWAAIVLVIGNALYALSRGLAKSG